MRITALALALLLPACIVGSGEIDGVGDDQTGGGGGEGGGGGGGGGDGSGSGSGSDVMNTPHITASVDKTAVSTELGKTETIVLTINSVDSFVGAVSVTPSVLEGTTPVTGWQVTANPPSVDLQADASAQVTLSVKIPTDTTSLMPDLKVDLGSTAAPVSVESAFTVANQLTINIPANTGTGAPHAGLPATNSPIRLRLGAKVIFHNGDTISHQIHAAGGINHEGSALAAGADYTVTPSDNATWYCHLHETS
ncbi:MAG TPA: hypothetical protein VFV99_22565, partial [Kofleriaceae bacterium]|nr:hypothetical protein [Kofleriaceae bacterium]